MSDTTETAVAGNAILVSDDKELKNCYCIYFVAATLEQATAPGALFCEQKPAPDERNPSLTAQNYFSDAAIIVFADGTSRIFGLGADPAAEKTFVSYEDWVGGEYEPENLESFLASAKAEGGSALLFNDMGLNLPVFAVAATLEQAIAPGTLFNNMGRTLAPLEVGRFMEDSDFVIFVDGAKRVFDGTTFLTFEDWVRTAYSAEDFQTFVEETKAA